MPLSDRPIEAGHRKAVVISGQNADQEGVTVTPVGADVGLDVNIVGGAGAGGTSMTDDAAFTAGATAVTPAAGFYDSTRDTVNDGDGGALAMTAARALRATLETPNADSAMDEVNDAVRVNLVAGGGGGGTSMTDDNAFTPATTAVTPIAGFADDTAPDSVDEGDAGAVRMSLRRELYVQIRDAAGNERGVNVDAAGAIAVGDGGGSLSVDDGGGALSVDDNGGALSVDDNGGSLTVDNPILSVVGGGAEATAQRVTIANDSTGVLSVDDNGGSLTVDGTVTAQDGGGSLTVDNAALSVVGGGAEATAQRVTIANDSTGVLSVDDNAGSLTVDNAALSVVGGGAEATAQRVTIANDSTGVVTVDDGGGSLTVDGTVTVQEPLSVDDNGGSLTIDNAALAVVGGGAEATAQRVTIANDSTGVLSVDDNAGSLTVDNAALSVVGGGAEATALRVTIANNSTGLVSVDDGGGALTVDGTVTAANAAGDVADDAVDSGNPVKIGGVAVETDGTDPTSVSAEGDRAEVRTDRNRRLLVNTAHPNLWNTNNNYAAAQTNQQQKAAPGANLSLYITGVYMSTDTAMNIKIVDDTAGAPADILGPYYFAANGGMVAQFDPPIRVDANTDIGITSSAAGNHSVTINGYTAP